MDLDKKVIILELEGGNPPGNGGGKRRAPNARRRMMVKENRSLIDASLPKRTSSGSVALKRLFSTASLLKQKRKKH